MKFYMWTLSIYSIVATVLIVMLAMQNRDLKQGGPGAGPPQTVNYDETYEIPVGRSPVRGDQSAPVTITVFSEFECPFCAKSNEVLNQIVSDKPDRVRVVYKSFPLDRHANARPAAAAAYAAGEQGKFWEMHDLLYLLQDGLNEEELINAAASLNLDMATFEADMDVARWKDVIDADQELGLKVGVTGTPTFFVNGVRLPSYAFLEEAVSRFLEGS